MAMRGVRVGTLLVLFAAGCMSFAKKNYAFDTERYVKMLQNDVASVQQVIELFPTSPD